MFRSFDIWVHKFPEFAAVFRRAGSPVTNQIANFDRNFKGLCRPGGQGNSEFRLDKSKNVHWREKPVWRQVHRCTVSKRNDISRRWSFQGKDTWRRNVEPQRLVANSGERSSSWQSMAFIWRYCFCRQWIRATDVLNIFRLHFLSFCGKCSLKIRGVSTTICPGSESTLRITQCELLKESTLRINSITLQAWAISFRFWVSRTVSS